MKGKTEYFYILASRPGVRFRRRVPADAVPRVLAAFKAMGYEDAEARMEGNSGVTWSDWRIAEARRRNRETMETALLLCVIALALGFCAFVCVKLLGPSAPEPAAAGAYVGRG